MEIGQIMILTFLLIPAALISLCVLISKINENLSLKRNKAENELRLIDTKKHNYEELFNKQDALNRDLQLKILNAEKREKSASEKLENAERLHVYYDNKVKNYNLDFNKSVTEGVELKTKNLVARFNKRMAELDSEVLEKAKERALELNKKREEELIKQGNFLSERIAATNVKEKMLLDKFTPKLELELPISDMFNLKQMHESIIKKQFFFTQHSRPKISSLNFSAKIKSSSSDELYIVTLNSCTCKAFRYYKKGEPCKHILYLAYIVGLLQVNQKIEDNYINEINNLSEEIQKLTTKRDFLLKQANDKESVIKKAREHADSIISETIKECEAKKDAYEKQFLSLKKQIDTLENLIKEKSAAYPNIFAMIANNLTVPYQQAENYLRYKERPAEKAADIVKNLKHETQKIIENSKVLEYKLAYIEDLFPNINDIFDEDFDKDNFELETEEKTDRVRLFLSQEEYSSLSVTEKNQLALDRYLQNRKSKWQIGRDYELYIGYLHEQDGYSVKYTGIIKKLEDMGRDLIATRNGETLIIQCKNWSQEKTIHEKHIFQLFGSVVEYNIANGHQARGVFISTTKLSEMAEKVANELGIEIKYIPLGAFPRIKCNINRTDGEKIYHLPFDQQYDNAVIEKSKGEFYALTVAEAESQGFRRAMRHFAS